MSYAYDSNFEDVLTAPKPEPKARLHGPHRIQNIQCVVNPWPALGNAPGIYDPSSGLFITDSSSLPKLQQTGHWTSTGIPGMLIATIGASTATYAGTGGGLAYTAATPQSNTIVGGCVIVPTIKAFEPDPLIKELMLSGSMAMGTITFASNGYNLDMPVLLDGPLAGYEAYAQSNWDGYDAEPIMPETLSAARFFLSMLPKTLGEPDIAPGADGTIGLEWSFSDRPLRKLFIDIGPGTVWGGYWRRANGETQIIPATPIVSDTKHALKEHFDKLSA